MRVPFLRQCPRLGSILPPRSIVERSPAVKGNPPILLNFRQFA